MSQSLIQTIRKLETYADSPAPILSVYLQLTVETRTDRLALLKSFDQLLMVSLTQEQTTILAQNILYIRGYLEKYTDDASTGLAMFSGGDNLWEVIHLQDEVIPSIVISHTPNLQPLLEEVRKTQRYVVILADRAKAIFFTLMDGELEAKGTVDDPSVPHHTRGKNADQINDKIENDIQNHLQKHMERIAQKVDEFTRDKVIVGVIIGGHKTTMHELERHLPKHLKDKILGEYVSELNMPMNDILAQCRKALKTLHISVPQAYHPDQPQQ